MGTEIDQRVIQTRPHADLLDDHRKKEGGIEEGQSITLAPLLPVTPKQMPFTAEEVEAVVEVEAFAPEEVTIEVAQAEEKITAVEAVVEAKEDEQEEPLAAGGVGAENRESTGGAKKKVSRRVGRGGVRKGSKRLQASDENAGPLSDRSNVEV